MQTDSNPLFDFGSLPDTQLRIGMRKVLVIKTWAPTTQIHFTSDINVISLYPEVYSVIKVLFVIITSSFWVEAEIAFQCLEYVFLFIDLDSLSS